MQFPLDRVEHIRAETEHGRMEMALRAPCGPLRGLVRGYCLYDESRAPRSRYQHLPHRDVTFILSLGGELEVHEASGARQRFAEGEGFIAGIHTAPAYTDTVSRQRGVEVMLTPLGAHLLLGGLPMHETSDRTLPLDDVLGRPGRELPARLAETRGWDEPFQELDAFFAERIGTGSGLPPAVVEAWRLLEASHGGARIQEVGQHVGWSRKRLRDGFRAYVGHGPKTVARVLRFDRAMDLLKQRGDVRWSEVALDCGYHDQAHLAREVRELSGSTPTELARSLIPESGSMKAG